MPPAAATAAGRRATRELATAHVPVAPRRVSGPATRPERAPDTRRRPRPTPRPAARPSSRATAAAAALEAALAPAPERVRRERPARRAPVREAPPHRGHERRHRAPAQHAAPRLALRLQAPRLDRIVRGRAWIPVLGAMLVAVVGLRVEVLKLGATVGTDVQRVTTLQSANAVLESQISALSDNRRIVRLAQSYGMVMPNPLDVHFVPKSAGRHLPAAIRNITAPSATTFLSGLATERQHNQLSTGSGLPTTAVTGTSGPGSSKTGASNTATSTSTANSTSTAGTPAGTAGAGSGSGTTPSSTAGGSGTGTGSGTTPNSTTGGSGSSSTGTGAGSGTGAGAGTGGGSTPPAGSTPPPAGSTTGATGATGAAGAGNVGAAGGAPQSGGATSSTNGGTGLAG